MAPRKPPPAFRPFTRTSGGREELWAILVLGSQVKLKMGWLDQTDQQLYKRIEKLPSKGEASAEAERLIAERRAAGWVEQPADRMPRADGKA